MTMPRRVVKKCAVCGEESPQTILLSTNRFGAPDLDLRPPEMMRSTMGWWVQECPHCSYVASDIEESASIDPEFLTSQVYRDIRFSSRLAERFYRQYLILSEYGGGVHQRYQAAIHAAWASDDARDDAGADFFRSLAIREMKGRLKRARVADELHLTLMDLYRRSGQFDRLIEEYGTHSFTTELYKKIHAFQLQCAEKRDRGCYTVADIEDL